MSTTLALSRLALTTLGVITAVTVTFAVRPAPAAAAPYCQVICRDGTNAACYERCQGNDQHKRRKIEIKLPPPEEPPVVKSVKQPDWVKTVFDPKGGGGNGGGGGGKDR